MFAISPCAQLGEDTKGNAVIIGDHEVAFHRLPVTDAHTFQDSDFVDRIWRILLAAPVDAHAVGFNPQMHTLSGPI